jgi:acetyl-CoA synthetase
VPLKVNADAALERSPGVSHAVVLRRTGGEVATEDGRDLWWHELVAEEDSDPSTCPPEPMDSEDLLYLLYTSGTTAKPKGIVHTTAGYLVGTATSRRSLRMILPLRVFGSSGVKTTFAGLAIGPIFAATCPRSSSSISIVPSSPPFSVT